MAKQKFRIPLDPQSLVPELSVRKYYLVSVGLIVLMCVALGLIYQRLPRVVPLLMTEPWGEARLVPKLYLGILPLVAVVVTGVNLLVGRAVRLAHKSLVTSLAVGAMVVNMMLLLSMYGIVQSLL